MTSRSLESKAPFTALFYHASMTAQSSPFARFLAKTQGRRRYDRRNLAVFSNQSLSQNHCAPLWYTCSLLSHCGRRRTLFIFAQIDHLSCVEDCLRRICA